LLRLFNPRTDKWEDHFELQGAMIVGMSAIGRATVRLLKMNEEERVEMRSELLASGDF